MKNKIIFLFLVSLISGCSATHNKKQDEQLITNVGSIGDIERYYVSKANNPISSHADKMNAYNKLSNYYIKDHDFNSALFYLGETKGTEGHDILIAKIDILTGKVNEAINVLNNLDPGKDINVLIEYYNVMGVALSLSGDYEKAMQMLTNARKLSNNSLEVRNNIAFLYILQRRYDEASDILNAVLRIKPNYIQAKENLNLIDSLKISEK